MKPSVLVVIFIAIALVVVGAYFFFAAADEIVVTEDKGETPAAGTITGMVVERNAIAIFEQRPGSTVAASLVRLDAPGYVVVHEDASGRPGDIIGASVLLGAGENTNIVVGLSRPAREGEILYAMLHLDTDNNGSFDASVDNPAQGGNGEPIQGRFEISANAPDGEPPVSI